MKLNHLLYKQRKIERDKVYGWTYFTYREFDERVTEKLADRELDECTIKKLAETTYIEDVLRVGNNNMKLINLETLSESQTFYDHEQDTFVQNVSFTDDEMATFANHYLNYKPKTK